MMTAPARRRKRATSAVIRLILNLLPGGKNTASSSPNSGYKSSNSASPAAESAVTTITGSARLNAEINTDSIDPANPPIVNSPPASIRGNNSR